MEKTVYKGQIIKVSEEKIGETVWERVHIPDGVIIFPITDEGKILLVEERRPHENPPIRIKPVSGILEPDKGTPAENAQREMQEEIGFKAKELVPLLTLSSSGTVNYIQHFFIGRQLEISKLPNPDGEDSILAIKAYSAAELRQKLSTEEIRWTLSTLGIFKLLEVMEQSG